MENADAFCFWCGSVIKNETREVQKSNSITNSSEWRENKLQSFVRSRLEYFVKVLNDITGHKARCKPLNVTFETLSSCWESYSGDY